jgi:hypothetical protein
MTANDSNVSGTSGLKLNNFTTSTPKSKGRKIVRKKLLPVIIRFFAIHLNKLLKTVKEFSAPLP